MKQQEILDIMAEAATPEEGQRKVIETFADRLDCDNDYLAKTIAAYVRINIENFHHDNLTDEQMRELNPLIRNAIYTFLEDWSDGNFPKIWGTRLVNCPEYWEDCRYIED